MNTGKTLFMAYPVLRGMKRLHRIFDALALRCRLVGRKDCEVVSQFVEAFEDGRTLGGGGTQGRHPRQRGCLPAEGCYELKLPYAQDTELLMNILKLGTDCTVLSPQELCERVVAEVRRMNDACAAPVL